MKVGTGSSEHDLTGDVIMMRRTLAFVKSWNEANDADVWRRFGCSRRRDVVDLSHEKSAKPSAV